MKLNRTGIGLFREDRNLLNDNWDMLENGYLSFTQKQSKKVGYSLSASTIESAFSSYGVVFTGLQPCALEAVEVHVVNLPGEIEICLASFEDTAVTDIIISKRVKAVVGLNKIHLNFYIEQGKRYILYTLNHDNLTMKDITGKKPGNDRTLDNEFIQFENGANATSGAMLSRWFYLFDWSFTSHLATIINAVLQPNKIHVGENPPDDVNVWIQPKVSGTS